jgi:AcrR family transcriptional regulator
LSCHVRRRCARPKDAAVTVAYTRHPLISGSADPAELVAHATMAADPPRPPAKRPAQDKRPAAGDRPPRGDSSREAILEAATRLMAERGYDAMSISGLAEASGFPASSVYWHFKSKRGVSEAVLEAESERFYAELERHDLASVPPRERIRVANAFASRAIENHSDFGRLRILLLLVDPGEGAIREILRTARQHSRALYWSAIQLTYVDHGEALAGEIADRLIDLGQAMFDGAVIASVYDANLSLVALLDQTADAILALGDRYVAEHDRRG